MRRILVLGGYGGFGGRVSARLAADGFEVLVAGRSRAAAERFCTGRPHLIPLALDRDRDLAGALAKHRPFALVDAAGPFQGASYAVAETCIAAGCHYLDLADGRDFVVGIGALDAAARAAGTAVLSGASSVPALSGAVLRSLTGGMERVDAVEMAISASNRATAGASVTRAILSYIGRPIRLRRAGRWITAFGWQEMRREDFEVAGAKPISGRLVGLADVPDLDLVPGRLPGRPAVSFRAGTELALANRALWLLSWLVRSGLVSRIDRLAPPLLRLQSWTSRFGSARSGMVVRVFGRVAGRRVERRWTLVADRGDGPEIPALAVPILLAKIGRGEIAPGARDAGAALDLRDYEPAFARLAIRHESREHALPPPLYRRVIGPRFEALPASVRCIHDVLRDAGASGEADVGRGTNPLARLAAWIIGFPPAGPCPLHVAFAERDGVETWIRDFGGYRFRSRLSQEGDRLVERFGPLRFSFDLPSDKKGLAMTLRGWRIGPLSLPLGLAPRSAAREWEEGGRFHFDVPIALPLVGMVVHYRGWLEPEGRDS
ncbi:DUF4166 domain-containing protein [uncultured Enterovirga sp.]|uniref:DUF4166 domain-containing protein n=1 Tax=uncultured Enterovirga sp. TaxID=2026352 RepID=UPI0035CC36DE